MSSFLFRVLVGQVLVLVLVLILVGPVRVLVLVLACLVLVLVFVLVLVALILVLVLVLVGPVLVNITASRLFNVTAQRFCNVGNVPDLPYAAHTLGNGRNFIMRRSCLPGQLPTDPLTGTQNPSALAAN